MSNVGNAIGLLALAQLSFSGWHLVGNAVLSDDINPFIFAFYREFLSSLLMVVLYVYVMWDDFQGNAHKALVSIKDAALGEDRQLFMFLGIMSFVNVMGGTCALALTHASIFAIFQPMIPCIATVISIIVGVEDFTWYKFVGILMAVAGAITVEVWKPEEQASVSAEPSAPDDKQHHYNDNLGVLVTIVQVTACATYLVYQKRILNKYPSTLVTLIYYSIGGSFTGLCVGVYALFGGVSIADMGLQYEAKVWLGVVYVVLFSTLYAWNAYTYASKYLAPSTSTIFMSLQPIFTASLIFMCFDTLLTAPQYVGGFLVVLGMMLTVLSSQYMPEAGGGGGWKLETLQSSYTPLAHSEGGGDQSYGIL